MNSSIQLTEMLLDLRDQTTLISYIIHTITGQGYGQPNMKINESVWCVSQKV